MKDSNKLHFPLDYKVGDCISRRLATGKYIGFIVVKADQKSEYNECILTDIYSDEKPEIKDYLIADALVYYNGPRVTPYEREILKLSNTVVPEELDGDGECTKYHLLYPYAKDKYIHDLEVSHGHIRIDPVVKLELVGNISIDTSEYERATDWGNVKIGSGSALQLYELYFEEIKERLNNKNWYELKTVSDFLKTTTL